NKENLKPVGMVSKVVNGQTIEVKYSNQTGNIPKDSGEGAPDFLVRGIFEGGEIGKLVEYEAFSHASAEVLAPDAPGTLLTYMEVNFLLAEAAEREFIENKEAAETFYKEGILSSFEKWGAFG